MIKGKIIISPLWRQVFLFLPIVFFIYLGDALIADYVPGFLQEKLGSPLLMGIVMSVSSIAGFALDLLFAKLLPTARAKRMMLLACFWALGTVLFLGISNIFPFVLFMLLAMVGWGLFYDMFGFAGQKYVVLVAPPMHRTSVWGIIEMMRATSYAIGPLILAYVAKFSTNWALILMAMLFGLGLFITFTFKLPEESENQEDSIRERVSVWHEMQHWKALVEHIWPMVVLGILLGFVDAVYWTTGTVVNDMLAQEHPAGGLFMTVYMISAVIAGIIMGKNEIHHGKKKLAEIMVFISGIILMGMTLIDYFWWYLIIVFVSSVMSSMAWPLLDAVYTDLLSRMGREKIHMMGLRNASHSIAYVIGPIMSGLMVTFVGELESFVVLGLVTSLVSLWLIVVTPAKIRLPQQEIAKWE